MPHSRSNTTFLWYDLETFGLDARRTRIAQFAAQRTDENLNPLGEPVMLFCHPADDLLPSPASVLLTGITPQQCRHEGVNEAEFAARIFELMAQPQTCTAGYNSLRFDDTHIRFLFYRNFFDAYEREWRGGNSRWDILDLMRLTCALRPDGIEWPMHDDGRLSFKLEHLARANGLLHEQAHDATSDVLATIALARKVKDAQPRLFDYYLGFRDKRRALTLLDYANQTPVLHVSGRFPVERYCAAPILPLTPHPQIGNRIICVDLSQDVEALINASAQDIAERRFVARADLPEGEERHPIKEVHANRCPALVSMDHLRDTERERLQLDPDQIARRVEQLVKATDLPDRLRQAFAMEALRGDNDPDAALYDGFVPDGDKRRFPDVRSARPDALPKFGSQLSDPRLRELLFRYQARNWPESLDTAQQQRWDDYRRQRLRDDTLAEQSLADFHAEIAALRGQSEAGREQTLLDALEDWACPLDDLMHVRAADGDSP
ncbi:MAG: exodeoxyribonuclease I [Xanthomonadales bacterium]|nr:exodeoxyribonuclease I [Xanthomonadales bacterium]